MVPSSLRVGNRTYGIEVDRGSDGWFGIVFPEASGCVAMGPNLETTLRHARANLIDWIADVGLPVEGPRWRRRAPRPRV
jgi:hypothetical protein